MRSIDGKGISYSYAFEGSIDLSLDDVSICIAQGEMVAILGHNGSGKSTLVKHFDALLSLQKGSLKVAGLDANNTDRIWELRKKCGMVFQNPDNQFVSSIVDEDIAFGLENYDTPIEQIPSKVSEALALVGMSGFEKKSPHMLSGGQKQRIALASVLALEPEIIVFDESTAMLDPEGRKEVITTIRRLHDNEHKTIILISHYMEEAVFADRIYIMKNGRILAQGTPREILTDQVLLAEARLLPPLPVRIYYDLQKAGIILRHCPLTEEELVEELCRLN
ncbi:MAG: energy-coupling factor transporter ATPase [Peptococcaceae bacterium]|nr:energy-coupling factor transporter ATPase [Peptococcaceae bacterium]